LVDGENMCTKMKWIKLTWFSILLEFVNETITRIISNTNKFSLSTKLSFYSRYFHKKVAVSIKYVIIMYSNCKNGACT